MSSKKGGATKASSAKRAGASRGKEAAAAGYLHGFTSEEQDRLYHQARFLEPRVHEGLPLRRARRLLEIGCGVGAQTDILLRRHPDLHVTGLDASPVNLARAARHLKSLPWARGRWELAQGDAAKLAFDSDSFDSAFLCWILEHVADPMQVLSEARRVLRPGSPIVVSEVLNATFFLEPYSPRTLDYWKAFNEHQIELSGDPFVGAKLGNLLQAVGFRDIACEVKPIHLDNREPGERAEFLAYWTDLLLSGAQSLQKAGRVDRATVEGMQKELQIVAHDPDAVFFYAFVQARATAL
ncbi:MAG: hypothetical protein RL112_2951 [Planctomycetota bacterium]|jgi:ubiquinone/menaquinone biosynthesis C-methylase UbiE